MNEQQERNKSQRKTYMHASAGGTHVPYHGTQKKDNIITVTNYKIDIFRTIISLFEKYLEKFLKKNNVRIEEELSSISSNLLHQCRNKTVQTEELHQHMERLVMLDAFRKHPNLSRKKDGVPQILFCLCDVGNMFALDGEVPLHVV